MGMNRGKALPRAKKAVRVVRKATPKSKKTAPRARQAKAAAPADQAIRDLAKRIVDLTEAGDDEASLALYADDIESTEMGMDPTRGLEAIRQKFAMWRSMVSNAEFTARRVWVDGDTIVIEWDGRCTLAANGRIADLIEIAIHEIRGGKIARERFYYNPAALQP
jgi:ketosteroid isomerase-like protein